MGGEGTLAVGRTIGVRAIALLSLTVMVPTILGLMLGEMLRRRLSEKTFRKVLLYVLLLVGLNLVRRAIMG